MYHAMKIIHAVSMSDCEEIIKQDGVFGSLNGDIILDLLKYEYDEPMHERIGEAAEFAVRNNVRFLYITNTHTDFKDGGDKRGCPDADRADTGDDSASDDRGLAIKPVLIREEE